MQPVWHWDGLAMWLLEIVIRSTLLLGVAAVAAGVLPRSSAALRHSIWRLGLLSVLLLPILSLVAPRLETPLPVAWFDASPEPPPMEAVAEPEIAAPSPPDAHVAAAAGGVSESGVALADVPPRAEAVDTPIHPSAPAFHFVRANLFSLTGLTIWLVGIGVLAVLFLRSMLRTRRLCNASRVVDESWSGLLAEARNRLSLRRAVTLREHHQPIVPLTCGVLRPVVLLPQNAGDWGEAMRQAVLLHELAHVKRFDVASQTLGRLACICYWFQPLAWLALRRLRYEGELACDDAVIRSGERPTDYAAQLLEVARTCRTPQDAALAVGMAEGNSLERRVRSLFDSRRGHGGVGGRTAWSMVLVWSALLCGAATIRPVAAQVETPQQKKQPVERANTSSAPEIPDDLKGLVESFSVTTRLPRNWLNGEEATQRIAALKPSFGEPTNGLSLGIAYATPQQSTYQYGKRIGVELFLRNDSSKPIQTRFMLDMMVYPFDVRDVKGKSVKVTRIIHWMDMPHHRVHLKPGEACVIPTYGLGVGDFGVCGLADPKVGTYELSYNLSLHAQESEASKGKWLNPKTGRLPFEIIEGPENAVAARITALRSQPDAEPQGAKKRAPNANKTGDSNGGKKTHAKTQDEPDKTDAPMDEAQAIPLKDVVWWKHPSGLESGFWLKTPSAPNQRIAMNSVATYSVLLRNKTDKPIEFAARLLPIRGADAPYLIPTDSINTVFRSVDGPEKFRADPPKPRFARKDLAYVVTLQPGESTILPAKNGLDELQLFVGDKEHEGEIPEINPRTRGLNWIVHPVELQLLKLRSRAGFTRLLGRYKIRLIDKNGKPRTESAVRIVAKPGGERMHPRFQLDVATLTAAAVRNAKVALWGKPDKGLQCGLRVIDPRKVYSTGDVIEAEVLWRNVSDKTIWAPHPRQLDLWPMLHDESGRYMLLDVGARFMLIPLSHEFQPSEVVSLGVIRVRFVEPGAAGPKDNSQPAHISLTPGRYRLSGSGGVSAPDGGSPISGQFEFRIAQQ